MTTAPQPPGYNHGRQRSVPRTLREIRVSHGISIRDLERLAGVSRATISQIERGRLVATSPEIAALELALGVSPLVTRTMLVHEAAP